MDHLHRRLAVRFSLFLLAILIIIILACISQTLHVERVETSQYIRYRRSVTPGTDGLECRSVHSAPDKCNFVRENCLEEEAGLFSYLQFYYCNLGSVRPLALILMLLWLCLLFGTIGIAASDFFCVNLSTISTILGMSESVAGVTFLAFGNGSPDVFSTFAAMSSHSGSLAIGELIGAAGFITAVVSGAMAIVQPFQVARKSFVRDVSFFIVAAAFSLAFIADGHISLWECITMVAFYVFYVLFVITLHWISKRRQRLTDRETRAREEYSLAQHERYHDGPNLEISHSHTSLASNSRTGLHDDLTLLEASEVLAARDREDDDQRDRWMAEISNNMRLSRPTGSGRHHTLNPIRPSLVGALEFRAVLASLEKSQTTGDPLLHPRRYSDDPTLTLAQASQTAASSPMPRFHHAGEPADPSLLSEPPNPNVVRHQATGRQRTASANDASWLDAHAPREPQFSQLPESVMSDSESPEYHGRPALPAIADALRNGDELSQEEAVVSPTTAEHNGSSQPSDDLLRPPENHITPRNGARQERPHIHSRQSSYQSKFLPTSSTGSSPTMAFPRYCDEPSSMSLSSRTPSIRLLPAAISRETDESTRQRQSTVAGFARRWWPDKVLPRPHVFASTLFPTLNSWKEKSWIGRILAVVAAPSVFLLAVTLPVVEADSAQDQSKMQQHSVGPHLSHLADGVRSSARRQDSRFQDASTDRYYDDPDQNEATKSRSTAPIDADQPLTINVPRVEVIRTESPRELPTASPLEHVSGNPTESEVSPDKGWNRWLVSTQLFTAPMFTVLIIWANLDDDHSGKRLLVWLAYTAIGSLVALAILLLVTTENDPPRLRYLLCFLGFAVSVAWISTIANEVVGILKAFGVILGISDAILGLTIFAVGNSLGDLVADITVARIGYPVMALSACFGGPMLNILLGIGLGGIYMMIRGANGRHSHHPKRPIEYRPYRIEVGQTLLISGVTLLVTLVGLLIIVPLNKWTMDRKIGWGLITLWSLSTTVNVIVELSGYGS